MGLNFIILHMFYIVYLIETTYFNIMLDEEKQLCKNVDNFGIVYKWLNLNYIFRFSMWFPDHVKIIFPWT